MSKSLYDDPIVAEVHKIRESLLAESGWDFGAYLRHVYERQVQSERRTVTTPLKNTVPGNSAREHVSRSNIED